MSIVSKVKGWFSGRQVPVSVSSPTLAEDIGLASAVTHAGQRVDETRSLSIDTVWACVKLISQTVSTLPLNVFRRDGEGFGQADPDHPLYSVLRRKPNLGMTSVMFLSAASAMLSLHGNHFSRVFRDGSGQVTSIIPFRHQRLMQVEEMGNGSLEYVYTGDSPARYKAREVLHLRGFSLDGRVGLSTIAFARQSFGNALAIAETTGRVFGGGLQASGMIVAKEAMTDEKVTQIHNRVDEYRSRRRKDNILVLPAQLEYQDFSINPDDAQMLETRNFTVEEVCRWFGVPPTLVHHMTKATSWGTGIEQLNLFFLQYGLSPLLKNIESEIDNTLIRPEDRGRYYVKFNVEGLLRGDSKGRAEYLGSMVKNSIMSPNEARSKEDLPPLEGGEKVIAQSSYVPLDKLGMATATKGHGHEPKDA